MSISPENSMMPVEVRYAPEENIWIDQCESLGVTMQGDAFAEAQKNFAQAEIVRAPGRENDRFSFQSNRGHRNNTMP